MCSLNYKRICINYFCSCDYKYVHDSWMMYDKKKSSIFNKIIGYGLNVFRKPTEEERIARRKRMDELRRQYGLEEDEIQDENIEKI